ncbi:MAG: METTL5 family protein [Nanoarchaeota archaeon]
MVRTKKELAVFLSKLAVFDTPKRSKEQYPTDSNVAAKLLWKAHLDGAIQNRIVIDLGCGTGILSIGALLLDAKKVIMVDDDPDMKTIIEKNMQLLESEYVIDTSGLFEFHNRDARSFRANADKKECAIIMNPPFGTSVTHIDTEFLKVAFQNADNIYTMHKSSTKEHIIKTCREAGAIVSYEEDSSFLIKNTMKEHRRQNQRIEVTLFHIISK